MTINNKVLVVEDELITAESIVELLLEEGYEIAGPAKNAAEAILIAEQADGWPAVALCDINLKGNIKGTELALELKKRFGCEIIFLTAAADAQTLGWAFLSEPVMYVTKPYNDTQLLVAVQMAFHKILKKKSDILTGKLELTERETEIARLVAEGLTTKQVARKLTISTETVKTHRRRMLQKNNIGSFTHLVYLMGL